MKTFKKALCFQHRLIIRLFFHPLFGTAVMFLASSGRQRETRNQKINDTQHISVSSYKIFPDWKWLCIVLVTTTPSVPSFPASVELELQGLPIELGLQHPDNSKLIFVLIPIRCQLKLKHNLSPVLLSLVTLLSISMAVGLGGCGRWRTKSDD